MKTLPRREVGACRSLFLSYNLYIMKKNPICSILWRDAAYTFETETPKELPLPRLTTGFIVEANTECTLIATNVAYDKESGKIYPVDGFIIPEKAIIDFKKIGNYHE